MSSASLLQVLDELKEKRKKNELSPREFYLKLLDLVDDLMNDLRHEDISEDDIKKQIPLILVFLEEQIEKLKERGH